MGGAGRIQAAGGLRLFGPGRPHGRRQALPGRRGEHRRVHPGAARAGAAHVTALDVGHGQLAPEVAEDPRVDERVRASTSARCGPATSATPSTSSWPTSASSPCGWSSTSSPRLMTPTARRGAPGQAAVRGRARAAGPDRCRHVGPRARRVARGGRRGGPRPPGSHPWAARTKPDPGHDGEPGVLTLGDGQRPGEAARRARRRRGGPPGAPSEREHRDPQDPARGPPDADPRLVDIAVASSSGCAPPTSRSRSPRTRRGCSAAIDIGPVVEADPDDPTEGCELVVVLGGDGTILRGAEHSRGTGVPLLGVNLGHVGFLAEAEREDVDGDGRPHRQPGLRRRGADDPRRDGPPGAARSRTRAGPSTRSASRRRLASGCSRWPSRSTAGRCRPSAATGSSSRHRPGRRPTRSRWAGR